jgi:hypothetical protein
MRSFSNGNGPTAPCHGGPRAVDNIMGVPLNGDIPAIWDGVMGTAKGNMV